MNKINTNQLELCVMCMCMTYTFMDVNGNRFCGKCKAVKPKVRKKNVEARCICGKCNISRVDREYEKWLAKEQKEARLIEQNL